MPHLPVDCLRPDPRFKITNRTIYQAEQLRETQLTECMAGRDKCEGLTLVFSFFTDNWGFKPVWWKDNIARNLEESLPNLTTVHINWCRIDADKFKSSSLPRNLKTITLASCFIKETISAKSALLFGLPYLQTKSKLSDLMISSWEELKLETIHFVHCQDNFGNPYGMVLWMHLNHGLEEEGSWQTVISNLDGYKWQSRIIRGLETFICYPAQEQKQNLFNKLDASIERNSSPNKSVTFTFRKDKVMPEAVEHRYSGSIREDTAKMLLGTFVALALMLPLLVVMINMALMGSSVNFGFTFLYTCGSLGVIMVHSWFRRWPKKVLGGGLTEFQVGLPCYKISVSVFFLVRLCQAALSLSLWLFLTLFSISMILPYVTL